MIKELIALGKENNIKIELIVLRAKKNSIKTLNNVLEKFTISDEILYNVKSLYKDKTLRTSFSNINNPNEIIELIKRNTDISDNLEEDEFAQETEIPSVEKKELNLDIKSIKDYLINLNGLKKKYKYIDTVETEFSFVSGDVEVLNEETDLNDFHQSVSVDIEFTLKEKDKIETVLVYYYDNKFDVAKIEEKIKQKLEDGYKKLNSNSLNNMKTKILMNNESVYGILDNIIEGFYARAIRLKMSFLVDKINTKIFSDKITIIEDPTNKKMIETYLFDGEGVKTYYKEIVKDGIFECILYNNKEGKIAGTKSTGNAFGTINCYIKPGERSYQDLIKEMNNGIIIDELEGLHHGVNILTGDISLQAKGFLVEGGKIKEAVKMFVMTTNIFELFNNVIEVGNDLEFYEMSGGSPSILFDNINISGN